ncbi:YihY/virulence factor BrkB family protein [Flammeovirgaceae bacterium SG7u.111]|nr:YihY/virulence factor BrkB family protein [Flammeovirgaceae bacterium SG7u.132]WPO36575.1 YihY/virulence factor BrkB family protein [Flammeovirgaceae bacterium SG7u.111]
MQIATKVKEVSHFFHIGIWKMDVVHLPVWKKFLVQALQIILLTYRSLIKKDIAIRASALTYYSLLSVVPLIAMAFGIAQGFGLKDALDRQLINIFAGQEEVLAQMRGFANSMLARTKGGIIAGIGLVTLIYSVLKLMNHIEDAFNHIWEVSKPRSFYRKFTEYTTFFTIVPIIFILSSSMTVVVASQVRETTERFDLPVFVDPIIQSILGIFPLTLIWILLFIVYLIMPNTRVRIRSGLWASLLAGTAYQFTQWILLDFQIGVGRYNAIYGSFAAIPIFLLWLQISWMIVLFGCAFSHAHQNIKKYSFEKEVDQISHGSRMLVSLLVIHALIKKFSEGAPPVTQEELVEELEAPGSLIDKSIKDLLACQLISEVLLPEDIGVGYQPAKDINRLTVSEVVLAIEQYGPDSLEIPQNETFQQIVGSLAEFKGQIEGSKANKLIKDID